MFVCVFVRVRMKPCLAIRGDIWAKFSPRINQGHQHDKRFSTCYKHLSHTLVCPSVAEYLLGCSPVYCYGTPDSGCQKSVQLCMLTLVSAWLMVLCVWASQWEDKPAIWYYSHLRPEAAAKLYLDWSMLQHPDSHTFLAIKLNVVIQSTAGICVQEESV